MKYFLLILLLFSIQCYADTATELYTFPTTTQQSQFYQLTHELRCLVCQNETIADSNASLAKDLRNEIANMILTHKTNPEILDYLVTRYGNFVLYQPPLITQTYILWFGPLLLLILGIIIASFVIVSRERRARQSS